MKQRNSHFEACSVFDMKFSTCHGLIVFFTSCIMYSTSAFALDPPNLAEPNIIVPEQIAGVKTVNAEQVIEILTSDNPPLLIDARIKQDRNYGYIENSISLPDIETNCNSLEKIIVDKKQYLMFYCNGVQCGRSVVSIKVARSCGYHNLSWFKGGFAEWKEKGFQYIQDK